MSYSICVTCGSVVRDHDDPSSISGPLGLPEHGCPDPRGDWPWNDGKHVWDEVAAAYVPAPKAPDPPPRGPAG